MTKLYRTDHRLITKRIIVRGTLVLDTPTCLGTGDADSPTDLPLLRDSLDDKYALLTGSSIAGALRNYLRERKKGYGESDTRHDIATKLFGDLFSYKNEQNESETKRIELREQDTQSSLIIDDAISTKPIQSELRDGVKIDSITRTAEDKKKYDLELLQAGTEFPLCFELLIEKEDRKITLIKAIATEMPLAETSYFSNFCFKWLAYEYKNKATLLKSLAIALSGLEPKNGSKTGEISLGMKKRRGFGRCHVKEWQVWNFDLTDESDRIAWLTLDHSWLTAPPCTKSPAVDASIVAAMKKAGLHVGKDWEDKRDRFTINATFTLASPLLIRSGQAETGRAPDVVHLKSYRIINQQIKWLFDRAIQILGELPSEIDLWSSENWELFFFAHNLLKAKVLTSVLSGTSLAGVLRHRAERIVKTLQCSFGHNPECDKEPEIVQCIFGDVNKKRSQASRLIVHESTINHTTDLVQTRIAIDRFTGGAYHGALFQEQPVFANDNTELKLEIELRNPIEHEIGLLLLLLKDLWTEDLPVGGGSSVGRGRLKGKKATMTWKDSTWEIEQNGKDSLKITPEIDKGKLKYYVSKLVNYIKENNNNEPSHS
jgi:CRISPR/Cas system CSM-associated protein Csm3 (group 7 of RAMP superfamily)